MHLQPRYMATRARGFTLIELIITVAVVAILAAIALPNYEEHVRRGRRAELQTQVLQAGGFMERYFTSNNSTYVAAALPTGLTTSPDNSSAANRFYDIGLSNVTANTFTLTAMRAISRPMDSDKCGDFTLLHTGEKGLVNNTAAVTDCWRR